MANPYKVKFYHNVDYLNQDRYNYITNETIVPGINIDIKLGDFCHDEMEYDCLTGEDYIEAMRLGMKLAKMGFDKIETTDEFEMT